MKVFASCDSTYFSQHSAEFIESSLLVGYEPLVLVINPTEEIKALDSPYVQYQYSDKTSKAFYASNRFLTASSFLTEEGLLITDIDCFFLKRMLPIKESIGLFLRPYEKHQEMKIAAGIVWLSGDSISRTFIDSVAQNISNRPELWYVDQLSLLEEYTKLEIPVFEFKERHMDWNFREDSFMWTGKGNRKYKNIKYLKKKKSFTT